MAIAIGAAALALARARQSQPDPNTDALQVLDTQSNLGAVSSKNMQSAGEKAVKAKPPKITITVGPDGEPTIDAKNLPAKSQVQQIREAQAEPYANFADTLKETVGQASRLAQQSPNPENLPSDPKALAAEAGIAPPQFELHPGGRLMRSLMSSAGDYANQSAAYRRLLSNPEKLRQMVASQRLKNRMGFLEEGGKAASEDKSLTMTNLAIEREKRLQEAAGQKNAKFTDDMLTSDKFHINRLVKSPEDAVTYMKNLAQAHGEDWNDELYAPLVKMKYADGMRDDAEAELNEKKKKLDITHEEASTQALLKTLADKNKKDEPYEVKPGTPEYRVASDLADAKLTFQQFRSLYSYSRDINKKLGIYEKAGDLNPNFNPAAFELGQKFAANPKVRQQISSADNALSLLDEAKAISDRASRSGAPALNRFIVKGGFELGGKKYSDFRTLQLALADEISGALGFGSATDMTRQLGLSMTDPNMSPEQFSSAIDNVVRPFLEKKRGALINQMGVYGKAVNDMSQTSAPNDPLDIRKYLPKKKGQK